MIMIHTAVLAGALLVCSASAVAQETLHSRLPVTGAMAIEAFRAGQGVQIRRTLRQQDGPVSQAVLDELADSLVAFVLEVRTRPGALDGPIDRIIEELAQSLDTSGEGTPYPGAGERLVRIAYAVEDKAAEILPLIPGFPDRQAALRHLLGFATSASHPAAEVAIHQLERMGPEGVATLRVFWTRGAITEPAARQRIRSLASYHAWPAADTTRPPVREADPDPPKQPPHPMTGAVMMHWLRTYGNPGGARNTLRQLRGPMSQAALDELADSLVAFVLANPEPQAEVRKAIGDIIVDLGSSAFANSPGTPYAGAGERLLRIASVVDGLRSIMVLDIIRQIPDPQEARAHLRTFARGTHPEARFAIDQLERMGPEGIAVLRTLWEENAITEPSAWWAMVALAGRHGWERNVEPVTYRNHIP